MAGLLDASRPSSRSYNDSHAQQAARPLRGGPAKTSRGPPAALRSLSPALQVIQKSLLADAPRVPDAPRGNRPKDYLSLIQASPAQGFQQTGPGDWKRSASPEIVAKDSGMAASILDYQQAGSTTFRSSRPRTPDCRGDSYRKAPMSARMRRTSSENTCQAPPAPLSARAEYTRPLSAMSLRSSEDRFGSVGNLWPTDRPRRGVADEAPISGDRPASMSARSGAVASSCEGFDALDALLTSVRDDAQRPESARTVSMSTSPRTRPGSELKCGIGPVLGSELKIGTGLGSELKIAKLPIRSQASTPGSSAKYDEILEAASPNALEVDDSRPSVYCSMSATLMSVHLPGSPIPKAVEFDDSDSSLVLLSDPLVSAKPQSRGQKVRFECHGQRKVPAAQASVPQAPRRKGTSSRPLGCTVVAFGGA